MAALRRTRYTCQPDEKSRKVGRTLSPTRGAGIDIGVLSETGAEASYPGEQQADTYGGGCGARPRLHRNIAFEMYPDQETIVVSSLPHLTFAESHHTDFCQYKVITATILPPDVDDPEQLQRLRGFVNDLVTLLRKSTSLSTVDINFRETVSAAWYKNGVANNSLPYFTFEKQLFNLNIEPFDFPNYVDASDLEQLLNPFQLLRNLGTKNIRLPPGAELLKNVTWIATRIETDTLDVPLLGGVVNDTDCLNWIEIGTVLFNMDLDRLSCLTAAMIRLERFRNWNEYLTNMRKRIDRIDDCLGDIDTDRHLWCGVIMTIRRLTPLDSLIQPGTQEILGRGSGTTLFKGEKTVISPPTTRFARGCHERTFTRRCFTKMKGMP
ncbi:hypothetical protein MMC16_007767 [Acarospora aff. strigata]|nr:hypothetical protein [Acarospora aff. strigata]